jgi:iron complex outermembrane recepter protein
VNGKTILVGAAAACMAMSGRAAHSESDAREDLTSLSIEQLLDIEVTIVSKTEERFADTAAAVTVITKEDVHRVGARTIPEALRLAPGLHVGRVSSSVWAVSSRGFSSTNSAKLLVLIDGRSIYTPLFSGVFWDVQDVLAEDIDRIEVVRGPGASLWGANAVNGVINVVTRSAKETQGAYVEGGGGNEHHGFAAARYGGAIGDGLFYRVYTKVFTDDSGHNPAGPEDDEWRMGRVGVRVDAEMSGDDSITFQGEGYMGHVGQVDPSLTVSNRPTPTGPLAVDVAGGFANASWTRRFGTRADLVLRATYDRTDRDDPTFRDTLDVVDLGAKSQIRASDAHELVWGVNYRMMNDEFRGKGIAELRPPTSVDHLVSGFAQDTMSAFDRALRVTLGIKVEHNDFSGFEFQPAARVAWTLAPAHTVWGAVSRAVRVPTRIERDVFADASAPGQEPAVHLVGNPDLSSEELIAGELGHRWRIGSDLLVDVAGFYFWYDSLINYELGTAMVDGGQTVVPVLNENAMHGHSLGGELAATWAPLALWRLGASYSYCRLELVPDAIDPTGAQGLERDTPRHQVALRSSLDLPAGLRIDGFGRWVDTIDRVAPAVPVSSYFGLDARIAWQASQQIEVSLVGQNLIDAHRLEFPGGTEVERSVYGKVAARF